MKQSKDEQVARKEAQWGRLTQYRTHLTGHDNDEGTIYNEENITMEKNNDEKKMGENNK